MTTHTPTSTDEAVVERYAPIDRFQRISGLSRSHLYDLLGSGELRAIKVGRRVLIDVVHGLHWLDTRPAPQIASPRARGQAGQVEVVSPQTA